MKAVRQGMAEGRAEILSAQLEEKFGRLPARTSARLRKATSEETLRWSRKVLTASTLKDVFNGN
jgi:hypothetical protein